MKGVAVKFFLSVFLGCNQQCSVFLARQLTQENHGIVESKEKRELCMHLLDILFRIPYSVFRIPYSVFRFRFRFRIPDSVF